MNRAAIRTRIQGTRFDASQASEINEWIDQAYEWVWEQAEWRFKYVEPQAFAVTKGQQSYNPYPTFRREVIDVFDDTYSPLERRGPQEMQQRFFADHKLSRYGPPQFYSVDNGQIYLFPTPEKDSINWWVSYERRLCHYQADGVTITAGPMDEDTDLPFWPLEYHRILVPEASMIGLGAEEDPSGQGFRAERDELLAAMMNALGPDQNLRLQYGA